MAERAAVEAETGRTVAGQGSGTTTPTPSVKPPTPPLQVDNAPHPAAVAFGRLVFEVTKFAAVGMMRFTADVLDGATAASAAFGIANFAAGDPVGGAGLLFAAGVTKGSAWIINKGADLLEKAEYEPNY